MAKPKPVAGQKALEAIVGACDLHDVDAVACSAVALFTGASGGWSDGGFGYGPWGIHLASEGPATFIGKGPFVVRIQAWAWTPSGIEWQIVHMDRADPSARGQRGHAAVYAIVYGASKPPSPEDAFQHAADAYDRLRAAGAAWKSQAAQSLAGPTTGQVVDLGGIPVTAPPPSTAVKASEGWARLRKTIAHRAPHVGGEAGKVGRRLHKL